MANTVRNPKLTVRAGSNCVTRVYLIMPTYHPHTLRQLDTAAEEGSVRLVNRVDVNGFANGALHVFCEGAWGAVCTSNFDDLDALVACRQLGFTNGLAQPLPRLFNRIESDPVRQRSFYGQWMLREIAWSVEDSRALLCV